MKLKYALLLLLLIFYNSSSLAICIKYKVKTTDIKIQNSTKNNLKKIHDILATLPINLATMQQKIYRNVETHLNSIGFFNPKITITISKPSQCYYVRVRLNPNKKTKINQIELNCTPNKCQNIQDILTTLPAATNNEFTTDNYNESLRIITNEINKDGYIYADSSKSKTIINPKTYQANIKFNFQLNRKITINKIIINDNTINLKLLYKIINFKPKQPFSKYWLEQARINLIKSGYFQHAELSNTPIKKTSNTTDIYIKLTPKKYIQKALSLGYDTDTKIRTMFGIQFPAFNQAGHQLQLISTIGTRESNASFRYAIPGKNPISQLWTIVSHYENYLDLGFATTQYFSNSINFKYNHNRNMINLSINSRIEKEKHNTYSTRNHAIYTEFQGFYLFNPLAKLTMRELWQIRSGVTMNTTEHYFTQYLVGIRSNLNINDNNKFTLNLSNGKTFIDNINDIPVSLQFAAGGGQDIRGYLFNELGPSKNMTKISYEYAYQIYKPWFISSFLDTVKINSQWGKKWFKGVGIAFSWHSDFVTMGISLARAISLPSRPFRLQFAVLA